MLRLGRMSRESRPPEIRRYRLPSRARSPGACSLRELRRLFPDLLHTLGSDPEYLALILRGDRFLVGEFLPEPRRCLPGRFLLLELLSLARLRSSAPSAESQEQENCHRLTSRAQQHRRPI